MGKVSRTRMGWAGAAGQGIYAGSLKLEARFHEGADRAIIRFAFELGQLREEARHGWLRSPECLV
jgi:hypothetical protein